MQHPTRNRRTAKLSRQLVAVLVAASLSFWSAAAAAQDEPDFDLPIVYSGGGMTLLVESLDERSMRASGTMQLGTAAPDAFRATLRYDARGYQTGSGQVLSPAGERTFRFRELSDTQLRFDFEGRTYDLSFVEPEPAPAPEPEPEQHQPTAAPATIAASTGPIVLEQHATRDPGSGDMESHTFLVPKGWQVEGGAWWAGPNFFNVLPSRDIQITSPDGLRVHLAPSIGAKDVLYPPHLGIPRPPEGSADAGYPIIYRPTSIEQWKQWFVTRGIPQDNPGATKIKITGALVVPELTQLLQKQLAPIVEMIEQNAAMDAMSGMRSSIDIAVLAIGCSYTHKGRDWEELFVFGLTAMQSESQFGTNVIWAVDPSVSYRAPAGQLDAHMSLLKAIGDSVRETPQWSKMKNDHAVALNRISAKGAADRSRILADSGREVREIITQGYQTRNAISDRTHERVIHTIRGTEDYVIPGTSDYVQLPNNYEHVYSNGNGEYLLSSDAQYDPNLDPTLNAYDWSVMQVRP